jgi:hypothetical protein
MSAIGDADQLCHDHAWLCIPNKDGITPRVPQ